MSGYKSWRDPIAMATCDTVCAAACAAVSLSRPELRGDLESAVEAQSELVLSLLASLSAVLRPLHKLETLLEFEALRREENPLLHTLNGLLTEVRASLAANGVAPLGATVGEFLDEERHERSARGGVSIDDDNLCVPRTPLPSLPLSLCLCLLDPPRPTSTHPWHSAGSMI